MKTRTKLALAALASMLSVSAAAGAKTTVTFASVFGSFPYKGALDSILGRFEKENPNIRVVHQVPSTDSQGLFDKVLVSVAAGSGPNVVWVSPERMSALYDKLVVPVSELSKLGGGLNLKNFYAGLVNPAASYKKVLWGVPFQSDCLALFYNKDLFAKAGIGAAPVTWDDMLVAGKKLTNKAANKYGIETSFVDWYIPMWFAQKDVPLMDYSKIHWASKEAAEIVQWYTDLMLKHKVVGYGFQQGSVGMAIWGPWTYSSLLANKKFDLGIAPLPYPDGGHLSSLIGYKELIILKNSDNAKTLAAWKLVKFLMEDANFVEWCIKTGYTPVTKSQTRTPEYQRYLDANPGIATIIEQIEFGCRMPVVKNSNNVYKELQLALDAIMAGKKSVQQALTERAVKAQALVDRIK